MVVPTARPAGPLTIDDRVAWTNAAFVVRIEKEKVDEFAQELQGIACTLGGKIVHSRTDDAYLRIVVDGGHQADARRAGGRA